MAPRDLDKLIDEVLQGGAPERAPRNLYGRIKSRLAVVSLIEGEKKWLRQAGATCAFLFSAMVLTGVLLWFFSAFLAPLVFHIPGAMGLFDYVFSSALGSVPQLIAAAVFFVVFVCAALVLSALFPRRRTTS